jgi:DNA (cytosine-5)-methyltransferase 1
VALRSAALCAGIGALDLGVKLARPDHRMVVAVERQAFPAAVLVARMEEASLDQAPIFSDLAGFDGTAWRGAVDLITAGYPCQPESLAGKRLGAADERWLWHEVWRVIREVGPSYVFLENVAAHLSGTFSRVLGSMAESGWRIEWDCVPAAAVGAPHLRDRVFILAANPDRERGRVVQRQARRADVWARDESASRSSADTDSIGLEGERFGGVFTDEQAARGHDADRRDGSSYWQVTPAPESSFRRMDDGSSHPLDRDWADRLHAIGNAVVPQAAAFAWRTLWERMHREPERADVVA